MKESFSKKIKQELMACISAARHCQLAELAALLHFCGQFGKTSENRYIIGFQTENGDLVKKGFTLLQKTFNIDACVGIQEAELRELMTLAGAPGAPVDPVLLKNNCCQRAYLRGAFLCIGSMSDPSKAYHLEFVCTGEAEAEQLCGLMRNFGIEGKIIPRKKYYVVYLKEGEYIADLLNVCGAGRALMDFENTRILKDVRNTVNRRVNCEAANITKTVNAAAKQIEDIEYIRKHGGLTKLAPGLRQMAEVRLEYPDAPLKELGAYLDPPVGKSGVNHRLRRLGEIADELRMEELL